MSLCFIFSGTSEGRELAEILAESNITCLYFVATKYGDMVVSNHKNIHVNIGRLDVKEIDELIVRKKPEFIIDATHPHAKMITENIITSCKNTGNEQRYIRVNRNVDDYDLYEEFNDTYISVNSLDEAVLTLKEYIKSKEITDKNILLTTGVKELKFFLEKEIKDRIIARVIPSIESLSECYRLGLKTKSIIAIQGPFSAEMNAAIIRQYNIGILITKNSGKRGGFYEKLLACKNENIKAIVIEDNEKSNGGFSVKEAAEFVIRKLGIKEKKNLNLIGAGVLKKDLLTNKAINTIESADVIFGAKRMAQFGKKLNENAMVYEEFLPDKILNIIDKNDYRNICVLYSGDTGLCSGAKGLNDLLSDRDDINVAIIPGISSLSYFSSLTGIQYSDYPFISLHGCRKDYCDILKREGRFIAICSGLSDVISVCKNVFELYNDKHAILGYNLGLDDEKIIYINCFDEVNSLNEGLFVILVKDRQ